MPGASCSPDADAMVPVPLHWRRQWARRFNQSALLAEVIAKASGRPVAHGALKRIKATPQQVGLGKAERAVNVQGAFRVPADGKAEVAGRKLVLVDDVLTSGATVGRLRAGAAAGRRRQRGRAGLRPGCGGGPPSHITRSEESQRTCPRSRFTPPAIAPIASPPSGFCRTRGSPSPRSTSAAIAGRSEMVVRANGRMTVPQIFIGATHVGGYDDLYALDQAGKLDPAARPRRALEGAGQDLRHEHRQGIDLHRRSRADALGPQPAGQPRRRGEADRARPRPAAPTTC